MALAIALSLSLGARAQVITYEGNVFPEAVGWERLDVGIERSLKDGWFIHTLYLPDQDFYRIPLTAFVGSESFFVEWRMITDNPTWLLEEWQVPTVVVAGGNGPGFYHTVMTDGLVRLLRSLSLPLVFANIEPVTAHAYRLELFGDQLYVWFVDGQIVGTGVPEGAYPDPTARLGWGAEVIHEDAPTATTAWDYLRAGRIANDASGDYDSDLGVTLIDHYFVVDCLTKDGPGIFGGPQQNAGPGCRFADFNADADVDLLDFAEFQNGFGG